MKDHYFEVDSVKPFSQSLLWELNRDFYLQEGIDAWRNNVVPHHMTSNSMVGKTYAALILAFLKDLAAKGQTDEVVYILELGAGHGRLAFHILKHLQKLLQSVNVPLPTYCYVLSDFVEDNLRFFLDHPQFRDFYEKGVLDLAHFDALESREIHLRYSGKTIGPGELNQPLIAIANYFFDTIPNELFHIRDNKLSVCSVSLHAQKDPATMGAEALIKNLEMTYYQEKVGTAFYKDSLLDEILTDYQNLLVDTYLFFPQKGMQCITRLKELSVKGLMLLSMDKGYHEIHDLEKKAEPDIVTHGSFSFWVNYHAIRAYCEKQGGKALFPSFSTFHLDVGCFLFLSDSASFMKTSASFQQVVEDFGPDDFNSMKQLAYSHIPELSVMDLIALIRLSAYDSTFFIKLLPRFKQVAAHITFNERKRIGETIHAIWNMYFNLYEAQDLAYELGGVFYDLGFYTDALHYFQYSMDLYGPKADTYYNMILCYYHLRQDDLCTQYFRKAKLDFPDNPLLHDLEKLDMNAV